MKKQAIQKAADRSTDDDVPPTEVIGKVAIMFGKLANTLEDTFDHALTILEAQMENEERLMAVEDSLDQFDDDELMEIMWEHEEGNDELCE